MNILYLTVVDFKPFRLVFTFMLVCDSDPAAAFSLS